MSLLIASAHLSAWKTHSPQHPRPPHQRLPSNRSIRPAPL